ncbi:hypothetical protein MB84_14850 [Pandoraea oxalativorans]|uniref:Major facilitator superfamily (MFS) profile domain-containing protein n=1 Tax=Pandoraea oxalativorans TaxID=573737 RepID=A0A0E3YEG9_9BURK|nr:hypothetical protein MB84_14850 [Pandoraea oxalativorans]
MQVFFAPILGRLSDGYGRRPVLMSSLAGATLDYAIMAAAPVLWMLYVGRSIPGVTGAVAASTVADLMAPAERTRWFGFTGARTSWPGCAWLMGAGMYVLCAPVVMRLATTPSGDPK